VPARGDIVLARFPFTDGSGTKLRPVLVLAKVPGPHDDYLVLFMSSQIRAAVAGVDVVLDRQHPAFRGSGLKVPSVLRIGKLATISSRLILGPLGTIGDPWLGDVVRQLTKLLEDRLGDFRIASRKLDKGTAQVAVGGNIHVRTHRLRPPRWFPGSSPSASEQPHAESRSDDTIVDVG